MKNLLCLLTALSVSLGALAVQTAEEPATAQSADSSYAKDGYSKEGYRRPGKKSGPKFVEGFLNGEESTPAAADTPETPASPVAPVTTLTAANDDSFTDLIKEACKIGMFVIRQPYAAIDEEGNIYVMEADTKEIGATYSLGFYIEGGYLFGNRALYPWKYDPKATSGFTPALTGDCEMADLSATPDYEPVTFDVTNTGNVYPGLIGSTRVNSIFFTGGFDLSRQDGEQNGYLVWALATPGQDFAKNTELSLIIEPKKFNVNEDPAHRYDLGTGYRNALGAIYVIPGVSGVGKFNLYLQGVALQPEADGKWQLVMPFGDQENIFDKTQLVKVEEKADAKPHRIIIKPNRNKTEAEKPAQTDGTKAPAAATPVAVEGKKLPIEEPAASEDDATGDTASGAAAPVTGDDDPISPEDETSGEDNGDNEDEENGSETDDDSLNI